MKTAERLRDWNRQPAIFVAIGRCDTCDGPLTVLGEIHGQATDGTLYLGTVFSIEIKKETGLKFLEMVIDRDLLAGDIMYARAVELCKALGSSKDFDYVAWVRQQRKKAHALGHQGMTALSQGKFDQAEENLKGALQIFEELDERKAQAMTSMNLGTLYYDRRLFDHAETQLKKALVLFEQINSQPELAVTYGVLGTIHFDRKEFDIAEQVFRKSLDMYAMLSDQRGTAMGYH